jgi:hypothetical protein
VSYDLYLLRKAEVGDDPAAAYEQLEERGEREPTPAEEQLRRLAADLQAARPGLDLTESDNGFFQLGYESGRPVVIDISAGEITMSWSYGTDIAAAALEEVRKYLPVFERHGYVAYDPQLERVFEPDRDAADAAELHRDIHGRLEAAYGARSAEQPWWKRLLSIGSRPSS